MSSWVTIPAVLMLLCPAEVFLGAGIQTREFESFRTLENSPRHRPWWWVLGLWLDPFRGALGAWLLVSELGLVALTRTATNSGAYGLFVGVLAVATILQTVAKRRREASLAPIGFLLGVVFALLPWTVALLGLTLGTVAVFALRRFAAFFLAAGLAMLGLGLALNARPHLLMPVAALFAVPLLVAAATRRPLELPTRLAAAGNAGG